VMSWNVRSARGLSRGGGFPTAVQKCDENAAP
jgi:hypothetical protein